MEFTREIYWNIGHGLLVLVPMYALTLAAIVILAIGVFQRVKIYRLGRPLDRTDNPGERIVGLLRSVLLQTRVLKVKGPGVAHAMLFWGFCILLVGTGLIVLQADFTDLFFDVIFLKGPFYLIFSITLDLAGLVAVLMLAGLFVRRYLVCPEGLETDRDHAIMYCLLFTILITGFAIEGARMAVTELGTPIALWSPVGLVWAKAMSGLQESTLRTIHVSLWWLHMVLVALFIMSIPFTKFRHMFTSSTNYFFTDLGPKGGLVTLDLENEEIETFGVSQISELSWKDIYDADACTQCKRCQDRCPAYTTGKPLSPMRIINQIGEVAFSDPEMDLITTVSKDALWACTTCRACQEICPSSIEHVGKIVDMRRNLLLMEGAFPGEEVMGATENIEINGNPFGSGYAARGDWAEGLDVKSIEETPDVDILYFVGCYSSFDKRNIKIATSFVTLCAAAGIKVGILGKGEKCCGDPVRKMGNEYLYQTMAAENIESINRSGVQKVVTSCPHCFNTLDKDYRELGLELEVVHYTTFLEQLVSGGALKLKASGFDCTYHDSCYLGRYNENYSQPRELLHAAGGRISEMTRSGRESFCCGAGGGRILAEENLGERIVNKRLAMAAETGMSTLVSNCPFCLTMFEDGIKGMEMEGSMAVRDVAEVLVERLA